MTNTYDTAAARREKDLAALAKMKEIEAKRRMKTVRIDARTIIGGSARSVRERMKSLRPGQPVPKKEKAPVRRRLMAERGALIREVFGTLDTLTRRILIEGLRTTGKVPGRGADKLVNYAESHGIIVRVGETGNIIYRLSNEEQ